MDTKPTQNPWRLLEQREIFSNAWMRVEEHQVINPAGGQGRYGLVRFQNKAAAIIPVDAQGYTWLVGQYRYTLDHYSWEIPAGGCPLGEEVLAGAQRELKEETGLSAARWTLLLRIHTSNSVTDEEGFVFVAQELTQGEPAFDDTEVLQIRRLPFAEAVELVLDGTITDSLSIAGLLKLAALRETFGL